MKEDKDPLRQVSTCLDGLPGAELIRKIMGEEGIGSLCEERMRSLLKTGREVEKPPQEAKQRLVVERKNGRPDRVQENKAKILVDSRDQIIRRYNMIESVMKLHKCADCSIRCRAARKPRSLFARLHRWHATWWPGWKLYQAELGVQGAKAKPRA